MTSPSHSNRRDFLRWTGAASAGLTIASATSLSLAQNANTPDAKIDPQSALGRLMEGNKRFVSGQSQRTGRTPADFATDAAGQAPFAAIIGCADSRVSPELVFDQDVGDLFVVRIAGNVFSGSGPLVKGSIEFAVAELGVRFIMVLGHSKCGAVAAAIQHIESTDALPGSIGGLVDLVKPAVVAAKGQPGDKLDNVIKANVQRCVARVKGLEPILSKMVDKGELQVAGGVYELSTGAVEIVA